MIRKMFTLLAIVVGTFSINAEDLFYTDFLSTPAGIAECSERATSIGGYDTLVNNPPGADGPKDTIIDGITFTAETSSSDKAKYILLSKSTQSFVKYGDTLGCTAGRLSLKNTGSSVTLPEVQGPCTITYYAASSSDEDGARGFNVYINDVSTSDAGKIGLFIDEQQATVKIVYPCPLEEPVVFKLVAQGSVYLYDVRITSGADSVLTSMHPLFRSRNHGIWTKDNMIINNNNRTVSLYTVSGKKIMQSAHTTINLSAFPSGVYVAKVTGTGTGENLRIIR